MIVIYNKNTRKVERVSITNNGEPDLDVVFDGLNREKFDLIKLDDDDEVLLEQQFYHVVGKGQNRRLEKSSQKNIEIDFDDDIKKLPDGRYVIVADSSKQYSITVRFVDENGEPVFPENGTLEVDPTRGKLDRRFVELNGEKSSVSFKWTPVDETVYCKLYTRIPELEDGVNYCRADIVIELV